MMNCRRATRLLSESRERKLSPGERMALKLHTAMCSGCRNFGRQVKILSGISRTFAKRKDDTDTGNDNGQ